MTNESRFAVLIETLRLGKSEFARAIGLSPTAVTNLVSGESEPSPRTLRKVCEVFPQVNYQWLTSGEGPILQDVPTKVQSKVEPTTESAVLAELRELRKEFSKLLNVIITQQDLLAKPTGSRSKSTRGHMKMNFLVPPSVACLRAIQ